MLTRLPIKVLAPLLFAIPVLAIGILLSLMWNRQSRRAVTELADQNIEQIHEVTATKIADVLSIPGRVCRVNKHLIDAGVLDPADLDGWRSTFVEQSKAFDMLSSIAWGGAEGRSAWVSRYSDGSQYWALKDDPSSATMNEWKLNAAGDVDEDAKTSFDFDLFSRPWFQAPRDADVATWCKPYVWVGGVDSEGTTLGISYGIPLHRPDGVFVGVIDADYSLNDLSRYLRALKIGKSGMAVLAARDAKLIAVSGDTPIATPDGERVSALESSDPRVVAAAKFIDDSESVRDKHAEVVVDGESYYLRASQVGREVGLDWMLVTIVPEKDFTAEIESEFRRSSLISLLAVAATIVAGLFAARWLVAPLTKLVTAVRRIGQGDLETRVAIHHAPEYENLGSAINKMAVGLLDRMRMQKSLSLAMEVQRNLLPTESPDFKGLDVAGHSTYCDETGGDYYDFLDVSDTDSDTAVIVIGDVMGHGVAAALLMATARGILRSRCAVPGSLADFLQHLNDMLVADTNGERFMTMLLVTITSSSHELRWASAGHGPPVVYDPASDSFPEFEGGGLPLGLVDGETYEEYVHPGVRSGAIIVASTDGVSETMNAQGDQYGDDRLLELIRANANKTADEISEAIRESVAVFRGAVEQGDDLTFVVAKVV